MLLGAYLAYFRYFNLNLRVGSSDALLQPICLDLSIWLAGEVVEFRAVDCSQTGQRKLGQLSLINRRRNVRCKGRDVSLVCLLFYFIFFYLKYF